MKPSEYKKKFGVKLFVPTETTPDPWVAEQSDIWQKVRGYNGKTVCNCRNIKDAILISAAPELLVALKLMLNRFGGEIKDQEAIEKAKEALKKAEYLK